MPHPRPKLGVLGVLAVALFACSSDAPPPATGGGLVVPNGPTQDPNSAACSGSTSPRPPDSTCVTTVRGQLVDSTDQPVSAPLAVCGGGLICIGSAVDEGIFSVNVNRFVDLSTFVLHVYGHPQYGDLIARLERTTTNDVTLRTLPRVPRMEFKGGALPAISSGDVIRSGPIELTLAPGTTTSVAPAHEKSRELLAGAVRDPTKWDANIVALYAVGPFGAQFSTRVGVAITLPASAGVAEGSTLELVMLENDLTEGRGGTLLTVGSAKVTGGVARSVAGVGIDRLTWLGVRVAKGG